MKGQEDIEAAAAGLIFVTALFIVYFMLMSHFQKIKVDVSNVEENIKVVDAAHAAKNCFMEKGEIKKRLLTEERANSCGLGGYYVRVKNLENGQMLLQYGVYGGGREHTVFAAIESDRGADAGEIYVRA